MGQNIAEIKAVDIDGLVAGIDFFNPAMVKLVMYPVAGAIVVSLSETLVAPWTRMTIQSQLEGNNNNNNNDHEKLGGLEEFLRSKFGYRLAYLGITSIANSCFKPLLTEVLQYDTRLCPVFLMSGAFSALTASIILLPFKTTRTNKGHTATFRDIWSDGGFRSLFLKAKPGVGGMTVGILLYEWSMPADHTWARVTSDLTRAVMVSFVPEDRTLFQKLVTGVLSALTTYIVSIPSRTNKFKDDDLYWFLLEVYVMTITVFVSEAMDPRGFELAYAGILALVSMVLEILIAGVICLLPADSEIFAELWRGTNILVNIVRSLTVCGVNSFAYLTLRSFFTPFVSTSPKTVAFTCGALASLAASLVSHPLDTLITHNIADHNPDATWKTTIINLCQKEGSLHSLIYAGLSASLFSIVPSMTINLVAYEAVSLLWKRSSPEPTTFMFDFARTSIATVTASTVMYPIEVVQRKMQMEKGTKNESIGLLESFKGMLRKGGMRGLYNGINFHLIKVVVGHAIAFTAFELFMKSRIDFFNPAMVKLVMYPVAGAIVVSLGETLVAPWTRMTILSQLEGDNNNNNNHEKLGGLEEFLRSKFGYRLAYLGITSIANSCFKPLLTEVLQYDTRLCPVFLMSGAFSALTASVILLPFKTTRTNKGYTATFRDIWSDGGFRSLFLKAKPGVGGMTVGILLYEWSMSADHTWARATSDLTRAVIVSFVPEVLRDLGVDVDHFSHNFINLFGGKYILVTRLCKRLCYYGILSLANSCFKTLLFPDTTLFQHLVSGVLSALTAYIVSIPFRTNKFVDSFKDDEFYWYGLIYMRFLEVTLVALDVIVSEASYPPRRYDLASAGISALVSMVLEILVAGVICLSPADFEIFAEQWRGTNIVVNIVRSLTVCGVNSFAYSTLRSFFSPFVSTSPKTVAFTCGALASLAASLVSHPLDTLITHNIADHNPDATWKTTIINLCQKEGSLHSLIYAGLSASLFSIVPSMTISLVACEAISLLWEHPSPESTTFMFDLARTSIATVTASTVMYPIEVVQRRMQMEKGTKNESISLLETFKGMLRKGGMRGLYSGINSHLIKVVVGHAIAFTAFELFMKSRCPNGGSSSSDSRSHCAS
ncbi:Adenine nucleotide transporter BT1, chloroplastic/amyloplastic/mitochondrial [Linum grandiflorum]